MSKWEDFKGKIENWAKDAAENWKDPEAAKKSIAAGVIGGLAPAGYPEHDGWRKEVRQNITNREIDREPNPFKDQLNNSLKNIKVPEREAGKDHEIER